MIVPPSSGRGIQKDQDPSVFWRVIVAEHGLRTRHVWPVSFSIFFMEEFGEKQVDWTVASMS